MRKKKAKAPAAKRKKAPSPAQLAARAKFIAMVRAKAAGKSGKAPKAPNKRKGKKSKGLSAAQKSDDRRVREKYDAGGWRDTSFFTRQN